MIAQTGRPGPVLVDITKDVQQASCDFDWDEAVPQLRRLETWSAPDPALLADAAYLINTAERPVILAGHGVLQSGALDELRTLAELGDIPVALTLLGIGAFPHFHPRSACASTIVLPASSKAMRSARRRFTSTSTLRR